MFIMGALVDITGKRFGKWQVIGRASIPDNIIAKTKKAYWLCKCDCGTVRIVMGSDIRAGKSLSCGCASYATLKQMLTGKPSLSRKPEGVSLFNSILSVYKAAARKRNLVFELTDNEFRVLINSNCHYCGIAPSTVKTVKNLIGSYTYNGVDRLDNTVGYLTYNCVPCCKMCNRAKYILSEQEFLDWVERVYKHSIER